MEGGTEGQKDGQRNKQTLFYWTLLATVGGPKNLTGFLKPFTGTYF